MGHERKTSFHPEIESAEGRVLAAAGLAASTLATAEIQAAAASAALTGQAWVNIANKTNQILNFQLSTDGGETYRPYHVRLYSTFYYHVNHNEPSFNLLLSNGSITSLATGGTLKQATTYYVNQDLSVTGGPKRGQAAGPTGVADPLVNVAHITIYNQTGGTSGQGGFNAKILFSIDGGQTYPISRTIPYTGGKVPTPVTILYGSHGLIARIPTNPTLPPMALNPTGVYHLLHGTGMHS